MAINLNETLTAIQKVGARNARVVPMSGQSISGSHQIEIFENGSWTPIVFGISSKMGADLIAQATNRLICG